MEQVSHEEYAPAAWRVRALAQEDIHFQCILVPGWPAAAQGWRMPINGDCRDVLGLNAVQALLSRVCDADGRKGS